MATQVFSDDPGALTGAFYFDGTDAGTTPMGNGMFAGVDPDESMLPAEQGAVGLVGPVTGAQHGHNAAQPGSTGV